MPSNVREWIERLSGSSPEEFIEKNLPPPTPLQKKMCELDKKILSNQLEAFDLGKKLEEITSKIKFARQTLIEIGGVISRHQEENNITPASCSLCEFFNQISDFVKELEETEKSLALKKANLHMEGARYCQEKAVLLTKN